MRLSALVLLVLGYSAFAGTLHAGLIASATLSESQINSNTFHYDLTLNDQGTTTIGTFWFSWIPGANFMPVSPTSISSPSGWNAIVTHGGAGDGFAIQWTASSPSQDLTAGHSLSGFSFDSTATPAQMTGSFTSGLPVQTSFVYSGGPFSDGGFQFVATNGTTAVPEPSGMDLALIGAIVFFVRALLVEVNPGRQYHASGSNQHIE